MTLQLDRKLYGRTNKVLEAGGKWNRKAKAHIFPGDATARVDEILLTGSVEVPKDEFNFFPTPPEIVRRLVAPGRCSAQGRTELFLKCWAGTHPNYIGSIERC